MKRFFSSIISSKKETKTESQSKTKTGSSSRLKKSKSNDGTANNGIRGNDMKDDDDDKYDKYEPIVIVKEKTSSWFGSANTGRTKSKSKSLWNNMSTSILAKICAHAPPKTHLTTHRQFARVSKSFSIASRHSWSWPTKFFLEITYDSKHNQTLLSIFVRNSKIVFTTENFNKCLKALKGIKITNLILLYRPGSQEPHLKQLLAHLNFIELNSFMSYNPNLHQDPFLDSTLLKKCTMLKTIQINFNPNIQAVASIALSSPAWQDLFKYNRAEFFGLNMIRKNVIFDDDDSEDVQYSRYAVISYDQLELLAKNKSLQRLFLENIWIEGDVRQQSQNKQRGIQSLHTMTWLKVLKFKCHYINQTQSDSTSDTKDADIEKSYLGMNMEEYQSAIRDRQERKARLKILPPTEAHLFPDNLETLYLEKMSQNSSIPWFGNCKLLKKLTLVNFKLKQSNELLFDEMFKFTKLETLVLKELFPSDDLETNKFIVLIPNSVRTLVLDDCINTHKWLLTRENNQIANLTIHKTFIEDICKLILSGSIDKVENLEIYDLYSSVNEIQRLNEGILGRLLKLKKLTITTKSYAAGNVPIAKILFKYLPTSIEEINVTVTTNQPIINPLDEIMYKHTMENMVSKQATTGMLPNLKISKWTYL